MIDLVKKCYKENTEMHKLVACVTVHEIMVEMLLKY